MNNDRGSIIEKQIHDHIHSVWVNKELDFFRWELGPVESVVCGFRVVRVRPGGSSEPWAYISVGISGIIRDGAERFEVFILSPWEDGMQVEMLAMIACYRANPRLEVKLHTILPIGHAWVDGSQCDHILLSLPFTFGPKLEWLTLESGETVRFLWALPITRAEATFAAKEGVEALEQIFDIKRINPVDPFRKSAV